MMKLLIKRFVKNPDQTDSTSVMFSYALICSIVGVVLNIVLFAGKYFAGTLADSITITADGFNNLSDAVTTFATIIGFWIARYGPGRQHPFGHGRYEWVVGLFAGLLVVFVGLQLALSSIDEIMNPTEIEFSLLIGIILAVSILLKLYMYSYNSKIGKTIKSESLQATSADCLADAIATSAVLVASIVQANLGWYIDGWAGLIVSALIVRAGFQALSGVMKRIIGQHPDADVLDYIDEAVNSHPAIEQRHDLLVHDYGFGRYIVSMCCSGNLDKAAELDEAVNDVAFQIHEKGHNCVIKTEYLLKDRELEKQLAASISQTLASHGNPYLTADELRLTQTMNGKKCLRLNLCIPVTINSRAAQIVDDVKKTVADVDPQLRCVIDTLSLDDFFDRHKLKKAAPKPNEVLLAQDEEAERKAAEEAAESKAMENGANVNDASQQETARS